MNTKQNSIACILVVEDIEETRDGIEILLQADGYLVEPARSVVVAAPMAKRDPPDLILVSLPGPIGEVVETANQLRQESGLQPDKVPIVIFCVDEVPYGEEVAIGRNIYLTRLDNFNQLRAFFKKLLLN